MANHDERWNFRAPAGRLRGSVSARPVGVLGGRACTMLAHFIARRCGRLG